MTTLLATIPFLDIIIALSCFFGIVIGARAWVRHLDLSISKEIEESEALRLGRPLSE